MDIPPAGGCDGGNRTVGSGDLSLPPQKHGCTFHYNQANYGHVSGVVAKNGDKDIQAVVVLGRSGCRRDADSRSGGGTDGGRRRTVRRRRKIKLVGGIM